MYERRHSALIAHCRNKPTVLCKSAYQLLLTAAAAAYLATNKRHLSLLQICNIYPRQGGYVFNRRCLLVCLSVSNFAQTLLNEFAQNFKGRLAMGQGVFKLWWRFGSRIRIRIRIATLVRRALAEVCTVPMLLVTGIFIIGN